MRFETHRADLGEGVIYVVVETETKTTLIINTNASVERSPEYARQEAG